MSCSAYLRCSAVYMQNMSWNKASRAVLVAETTSTLHSGSGSQVLLHIYGLLTTARAFSLYSTSDLAKEGFQLVEICSFGVRETRTRCHAEFCSTRERQLSKCRSVIRCSNFGFHLKAVLSPRAWFCGCDEPVSFRYHAWLCWYIQAGLSSKLVKTVWKLRGLRIGISTIDGGPGSCSMQAL